MSCLPAVFVPVKFQIHDAAHPNAVPNQCPIDKSRLEALLHPGGNRPQVAIDLAWRLSENQADHRLPCNVNVLESSQDVNLRVCQNDTSSTGILNSKLGLSILSSNSTDSTGLTVTMHRPHVLDLEGLDVKIVETEEGNGIVHIESKSESLHKVLAFLQSAGVTCVFRSSEFDGLSLDVHTALQLQMLDEGRVDRGP